ncbi:MAG: UDP-N-acetylmuramoyl-L-alanyl-D-glutamate--2,6-diaminopimelate ligase [Clostridiales bacterium]|nr:UDP-N-acetylmuramoyl-L-alanyl-D-glutamate--2,6-diaminopimelate ligase [Clostridiales bacterium]
MKQYTIEQYIEMLKEAELLDKYELWGRGGEVIASLTYDSKEAEEGTLFICKGAAFKAEYLQEAVSRGAYCYVAEKAFEVSGSIPFLIVKDIRKAMALLANKFYDEPWRDLKVIAFGGTKGKSTSVYYMKSIIDGYIKTLGKKESAVISSIDIYDGKTREESHITTPEALELQRYIRNAADSGIEYLGMEASSQAFKYGRTDGMRFDIAAFLNISEDHISPVEHEDFEDYFSSKLKMFQQTDTAIVNLDTDHIQRILEGAKAAGEVVTFSTKDENADYYAYDIKKDEHSISFRVRCRDFDEDFILNMPGLFNVENGLCTIAAAGKLGIPKEYIKSGLSNGRSKGRMELFMSRDRNTLAIVDYAHNKLSFERLFAAMKEEYPQYRIVSIFGCPGKKALNRRKELGTIAGRNADYVYLVAEDPGQEPVEKISGEIAEYVKAQGCPYEIIEDRGQAIKKAIDMARGKTLLLITGKGQETRQKYGTQYLDYTSDTEYIEKYLI